jgi:ATP adenylyltransferase
MIFLDRRLPLERKNLWAPWRIGYILDINNPPEECFICTYREHPDKDDTNLVLWRSPWSIVVLNRYPYNNGHMLIAPQRHIAELSEATDEELLDMMKLVREAQQCLTLAIHPQGFNVGINVGRCAGAGLPGHLHLHIVPRWDGDTNFVSVCSDTKVISQSLEELLEQLRETSREHELPKL